MSAYVYCMNNPLNLIDPDGREADPPSKGWNRFWGGLRLVGGAIQIAGGAGASSTGVGAVVGVVAILHGADDFQTGARQLWTGEQTESLTYKGVKATAKATGADDTTASRIATGADIGLSFVGGGVGGLRTLGKFSSAEASAYSKIGSTGKIGEDALKLLGGESQVFFKTSKGARFVDQLVNGIANESKVGKTSLTKDVITQIAKDVELMKTEKIEGAVWNFFRSPVTGEIGATKPLLQALKDAGIKAVLHE